MEDLGFPVVEAPRVPGPVIAPFTLVEILVERAVETADPLHLVGGGVGVDDVHDDGDPQAVGGIDERLEILGGAEPG